MSTSVSHICNQKIRRFSQYYARNSRVISQTDSTDCTAPVERKLCDVAFNIMNRVVCSARQLLFTRVCNVLAMFLRTTLQDNVFGSRQL